MAGVELSACIINSVLEGKVTVGSKSLVTNCCIDGDVHIKNESFISGLIITDAEKVLIIPPLLSLVTNCCIDGYVHIKNESFISGLIITDAEKVLIIPHPPLQNRVSGEWGILFSYCSSICLSVFRSV